jgi:hypothetical protein
LKPTHLIWIRRRRFDRQYLFALRGGADVAEVVDPKTRLNTPGAVMPALVTGIHVETSMHGLRITHLVATWVAGTGPGHDGEGA